MNYNKYQFSKVNDKKVLHKIKKQWVVISLAILMALGGGAAVGYTAHADTTAPTVENTSTSSGKQASGKTTSQSISNRAKALHSSILKNSSDQGKPASYQNDNVGQNNHQGDQSDEYTANKAYVSPLTGRPGDPENTAYNNNVQIDIKYIYGNMLNSPHYHLDESSNWIPDSNFKGYPIDRPISLSSMIPTGYCYIYKPNYNPEDSVNDHNSSYLTVNGNLPTNWNGDVEISNGINWQPSSNQITINNPSAYNSTNHGELSLYVYPILLTQGNVKVRVIRHYFNGSYDVHWVNLPNSYSAVTDGLVHSNSQNTPFYHKSIMYNVSDTRSKGNINLDVHNLHRGDNMPKGDGYYGDMYTYTLPNNWQSLDRSGINYNSYLKGFSASDNNSTILSGKFQLGNNTNQGDPTKLSNGILTLNYNQNPDLNLTINYDDNNTYIKNTNKSLYTINLKYNQSDKPTRVSILTLPANLSGDYEYTGKYRIDNGGTLSYKDPSHSIISYMMNSHPNTSDQPQAINIYLTRRGMICIKYIDSKTGKVIDVKTAGHKSDGTPFDYKYFEYGNRNYNPLPINYQLDNSAKNEWNLDPINYPYYTNLDQSDIVYVKPIPKYQITIEYRDIDNNIVAIKNAGSKPAGSPFSIKPYEENLPKNYQLDNYAHDDWNSKSVHYPQYGMNNQTDIIYVKHSIMPVDRHVTNILTVNYRYQNGDSIPGVPSKTEQVTYSQSGIKDKVTNQNFYSGPWNVIDGGWPSITSPNLQGYEPDKAVINEVSSYNSGNKIETVVYHKMPVRPHDTTSFVNRSVTNTLTVNYRDQDGHPIPGVPSKAEQITYAQSGIKDKVTGQTSYSGSWNVINGGWPSILSPDLQGRGYSKPNKAVINEVPSYNSGNKIETVVYHKMPVRPHDTTSSVNRSVTNTLTVNYRDQDGHPIPGVPSKTEQITYAQSGIKNKVTGQTSYSGSWNFINGGWPLISSPDLQSRGYSKPSRAVIDDVPSYNSGNKIETVIYHKINTPNIPAHNVPVKPHDTTSSVSRSVTYTLTVNYRDQNGNLIPGVAPKSQSVSYIEYGTKDDKTGAITWHNDWTKHRNGGWSPILSPDLTSLGYGKPSRQIINDVTPDYDGSNKIENVYYSKNVQHHSQVPNTPITPVPKPNNPVTPNPVKPSVTPNVPKIPSQPGNTPQLPASNPSHNHTNMIHPNNGVTPTSKHVKLHKLIKRYKHHRHSYQKWIPRLITNHKKNLKHPNHYKINKRITHHFGIVTYHHYNDHQSSPSKFELPQTNETNGYHKAWSVVLMGFAMIITAFGLAVNITKNHIK